MNTKMKILIGYDGVNPAERILNDLKRAGLPKQAEVLVLTVAEGFMPSAIDENDESQATKQVQKVVLARIQEELKRAKIIAHRTAKKIQAAFPNWKVKGEGCVDSPAGAIVKKAKDWKSDLVIVGSHNQPRLAQFFLGSVAQKVVRAAPCSVRIVRMGSKKEKAPIRIVIGVDGSRDSELAVQTVINRIWKKGSSVHLITAVDNPMKSAVFVPGWSIEKWVEKEDRKENEWIRRMSLFFERKLVAAGLNVSILVKIGDPKRLVVAEAIRWGADCIFVGAKGHSKLERFFMGSVSSSVAARAQCSVEVVRGGVKI